MADSQILVDNTNLKQISQDNLKDYTRVTEVLYPFSGLSNIKPDILANAARRGTRVHDICEGIMKGLGE